MEELPVSNDALPSPESSISTKENNNKEEKEDDDDDSSPTVFNPTDTGTVNIGQDVFNLPTPKKSDVITHSNSNAEPNILMPDEISLHKMKASRIIDSSVTVDSPTGPKHIDGSSRVMVDTAAPIESVKDAVSKFGGIVDWKTHKLHTFQRCRFIDMELDKTQDEIIECRKMTKGVENSTTELYAELERTMKQINELELQLRSSLSADEDLDTAAKQELEAIVAEHEAALDDLKFLKEELNAQKSVANLTAEMVTEKQSLAAVQANYEEAEGRRRAIAVALEQDNLTWETEMKQIEAEVDNLNQEYLSAKNLKIQLDSASEFLCRLKAEQESKINQETELVSMQKEVEMVTLGVDKAAAEVSLLKVEATGLQSEHRNEQNGITELKEKRGITIAAVKSLEAELSLMKSEIVVAGMKTRDVGEKLEELTTKLQQAVKEADQVKFQKQAVEEELITSTARLHTATKGKIEVETVASADINSPQETETVMTMGGGDTISTEDEGKARARLSAALFELDAAKKSEFQSLKKLEQVSQELSLKKEAYATATEMCNRALNNKLKSEQELRIWRSRNEQRRKANVPSFIMTESAVPHPGLSPRSIKQRKDARKSGKVVATEPIHNIPSRKYAVVEDQCDLSADLKLVKKKKRSLFPRLLMFFGKRKPHASKKLLKVS